MLPHEEAGRASVVEVLGTVHWLTSRDGPASVLLDTPGVREFTMPLVLYSQDNVVLSVLLWQLFQSGQPALSAALASIIVAVVLPVIFVARRTLARRTLAE